MLLIPNIRLNPDEPPQAAIQRAAEQLGLPEADILHAGLHRIGLDARKRTDIHFVCTVALSLMMPEAPFLQRFPALNLRLHTPVPLSFPHGTEKLSSRPVVAGFGPAGMFCALLLAREGYRPLVLERGAEMDSRVRTVEAFKQGGPFDPTTNIQFGEGGAGTFSDGKLTTRINSPYCEAVLREFVRFGAPEEILYRAKPHIGSDLLRAIVKHLRREILDLGGEIRFQTRLSDFSLSASGLSGITAEGQEIPCRVLVAAIGHSARDTFNMLFQRGLAMQQKPFSVGVRIEHEQAAINRALYGEYAGHPALPPGEYQLSLRKGERAAYTFCMCPGGFVVPAASEENAVVTNGMSNFARSGPNANSALVVSVNHEDFGNDLFAGVEFQRRLERAAFRVGGKNYRAPAQTVGNYLARKPGLALNRVIPSYLPGITEADLNTLLPPRVNEMLHLALPDFDRRIHGFAAPDAVLTGVETRTSSPIRILRNEALQASCDGIYPCGEGAGYAGGIMSAAVDGIRVAEAIIRRYAPPK